MNQEIILKLPVQALDQIAKALSERPYKEVAQLLSLIQAQANNPGIQGLRPPMTNTEIQKAWEDTQPSANIPEH
jgi:hypothetical protein